MTYSASSGQKKNRSWLSMSWCCPLFICLSFFFWPELAEYVMVLSTVYMFVIFLLAGAG
jgi:hypothetical protein